MPSPDEVGGVTDEATMENTHRITGSIRVEDRVKGRVWVAAYLQADGFKTRETLDGVGSRLRQANCPRCDGRPPPGMIDDD